ncbi:MAG: Bug family tripartite tricarboxylate transporter substrate binding protein [Rhodospirillaceae bacterium]
MKCIVPIACALALANGAAYADPTKGYPSRPIRLIMPIGPGSANDTLGRIVANKMGQLFGQQIVVDNRAGAGGIVGMEVGANAAPDGYTLIGGSAAAMSIVPHLHKKIPYDSVKSYDHIGQYAVTPNILIVNNTLPVRTVRELIDYANARNGNINMASAGVGSQSHLTGVMFMVAAKMKSFHVPYKGGGGTVAVRANESQWQLPPAPSVMGLIRSGQVRALGHTMPHRSPLLPDIPPIAETLPGFNYSGWNGLLAPRGTPPAVLRKLHETMVKAVTSPDVRKEFEQQVAEIQLTGGEEFRAFVAKEIRENAKLVEAAGLKPE